MPPFITSKPPQTMIQGHPTDASRALASCAGGAPVLLDLKTGSTSKLPLFAANMCAPLQ